MILGNVSIGFCCVLDENICYNIVESGNIDKYMDFSVYIETSVCVCVCVCVWLLRIQAELSDISCHVLDRYH